MKNLTKTNSNMEINKNKLTNMLKNKTKIKAKK